MKQLNETIEERPWAKYVKNSKLIRNPILGFVTQEEIDEAMKVNAIFNQYGTWKIKDPQAYRDYKERAKQKVKAKQYQQEANDTIIKDYM